MGRDRQTDGRFTSDDPDDETAYGARWTRIMEDDAVTKRTMVVAEKVAGYIAQFSRQRQHEITCWLGRPFWGRGVATEALSHFMVNGRDHGFANARGGVIEELLLEFL